MDLRSLSSLFLVSHSFRQIVEDEEIQEDLLWRGHIDLFPRAPDNCISRPRLVWLFSQHVRSVVPSTQEDQPPSAQNIQEHPLTIFLTESLRYLRSIRTPPPPGALTPPRTISDREKQLWTDAVKFSSEFFTLAPTSLKMTREFVLATIAEDSLALQDAHTSLQTDPACILAAVRTYPDAIRCASPELKNRADFMREAIQANGSLLSWVSGFLLIRYHENYHPNSDVHALCKERGLVLNAVSQHGPALKYADPSLKEDREIALAAIKQSARALQNVPDTLTNDPTFLLEAVTVQGLALAYIPKELQSEEIILAAVKQNGLAWRDAREDLRTDPTIIFEALKNAPALLADLPEDLKSEERVCAAVENNGFALLSAPPTLRQRADIVIKAVRTDGLVLRHVSEELKRTYPKIIRSAVQENGGALEWVPEDLKTEELVRIAVENCGSALRHAPTCYTQDPSIVLSAIANDPYAFEYADEALKKNRDFVLAAVRLRGAAIDYADPTLQKDPQIIKAAFPEQDSKTS